MAVMRLSVAARAALASKRSKTRLSLALPTDAKKCTRIVGLVRSAAYSARKSATSISSQYPAENAEESLLTPRKLACA
jgi:hypothetical protein